MDKIKIYFMNIMMFFIDVFNTIINYFLPYKSILKYDNEIVEDITIYYYLNYLINLFLNTDIYFTNDDLNDDINYIYRIHIRKTDKYFIYNSNFSNSSNNFNNINDLIFSSKIINDDNINQPRNLFIKYKILINNLELQLEDKIFCKKHNSSTKLVDIFKFNNINNLEKIEEIIIYKNEKEFKRYNSDILELTIKDIYIYL